MRDLLKRLEVLERIAKPLTPLRIVRHAIKSDNGQALPFDPARAYVPARLHEPRQCLAREAGETVEAFEARALAHFADAHSVVLS